MTDIVCNKLEDGTFSGRILPRKGVTAVGPSLPGCEEKLRSALGDSILVALKLKHPLPAITGIDLNKEPNY